jgi:hypothetical protein
MKELILVDKEELKQVFLEILGTQNQASKEIPTNQTSNYISASDVAKMTGSHITTVRRWTSEGLLNSFKLSKKILYESAEVNDFIRKKQIQPRKFKEA